MFLKHINRIKKYITPPPPKKKKKEKKKGRAVPLKWAEQSRIEKWAESSGPRSPGPKWFWAEEFRNPYNYQKALYTGKHFYLPKIIEKTTCKEGSVCPVDRSTPCGLLFYVYWIIKMYTCGKKRYTILKRDK